MNNRKRRRMVALSAEMHAALQELCVQTEALGDHGIDFAPQDCSVCRALIAALKILYQIEGAP